MLDKLRENLLPKTQTSLYIPCDTLMRLDAIVDRVRAQGNGKATRNMLMALLLEEGLDALERDLIAQEVIPDLEAPSDCMPQRMAVNG